MPRFKMKFTDLFLRGSKDMTVMHVREPVSLPAPRTGDGKTRRTQKIKIDYKSGK